MHFEFITNPKQVLQPARTTVKLIKDYVLMFHKIIGVKPQAGVTPAYDHCLVLGILRVRSCSLSDSRRSIIDSNIWGNSST